MPSVSPDGKVMSKALPCRSCAGAPKQCHTRSSTALQVGVQMIKVPSYTLKACFLFCLFRLHAHPLGSLPHCLSFP